MHALVTELYDCDLSAILFLNKFTFDQVLALSFQLLKALTVLNENGIIHSDIKPDNILYSRTKNEFTLFDFALSHAMKNPYEQNTYQSLQGNFFQTSPEVVNKEKPQSTQADTFSIGIIILQALLNDQISTSQIFGLKNQLLNDALPDIKNHQNYDFIEQILFQMINFDQKQRLGPPNLIQKLQTYKIDQNSLKTLLLPPQQNDSKNQVGQQNNYQSYQNNIMPNLIEPQISQDKNIHIPSSNYATKVQNLPDYTNHIVKSTLNKLGKFIYKYSQYDDKDAVELGLYQIGNDGIYQGQWKNGQRHGRGKNLQQGGTIYEGYWKNNEPNGYGRLIYSDGDVYEGQWKNGKSSGLGNYTTFNGAQYIGNWVNGKQHGNGIETSPDGAKYEGQFFEGKMQGKGKLIKSDGSQYEGQFFNNDFHGFGIYIQGDNTIYKGEWKDSKKDGQGEYFVPNESKYIGSFKKDKKCGYGEIYWPIGAIYKGYWENDMTNGYGRFIHNNGDVYEGQWKNDKTNGFGTYTHFNGAQYIGNWVNNKQHGNGIEIRTNGAKFDGQYFEGNKQGKGKLIFSDGSQYEGQFINNNIHGLGIYISNDNKIYKGEWKDNYMDGQGEFFWPALAVGTITCLDLNIGNRMPHCFYLDLAAKETVNIQYEVTGYKAQEFRMTIYDASKLNEQPIHTTEKEKSTTYSLWSQDPKEYKVCFQSLDSSGKILQFEFIRGEKLEEGFVNDKTLEKTFDILQDAQYQLNVIYSNLRHQLMKTDMQAQILESTENKVKWCSVIKMVLMISITTIQIVFLTGLFKDSTPFGI